MWQRDIPTIRKLLTVAAQIEAAVSTEQKLSLISVVCCNMAQCHVISIRFLFTFFLKSVPLTEVIKT